jgi:tetratricopeptide (TPR) repeat protein
MELTVNQQIQELQQGAEAHNAGKRLYRGILQVQPNHPEANHNLGLIAVAMNQPGLALPLFKSAIEANPNVESFWLSYIDALIAERQFSDAKQALKKSKKKGVAKEKIKTLMRKLVSVKAGNIPIPVPPQAELHKLIDHYQNERYADAERLALSIIKQFPDHSSSYNVLGGVYKQTGKLSDLIIVSEKVVALSPKDAGAHSNLGLTLKELGRLEESELSYKRAVKLKPDFVEVHKDLGNVLSELGKLSEAEESYKQAVTLKHDDAEVHNNLGNTLLALGKVEEAETSFGEAIGLRPDFVEAHFNLGAARQQLGRLEASEVSYKQAIALKSDWAEAHCNLGVTLKELGRLDEAEACYRQAIALKADFAEPHNNLGVTLKDLGRLAEAEASYRQAIESNSDYAEAYCNLGNTLNDSGRYEEGEACYRQAIVLKPDFPEVHKNLAIALYNIGDKDSALESIEKAYEVDPKSKPTQLLLNVMKSRKSGKEREVTVGDTMDVDAFKGLISNPLILKRVVEAELIDNLYGMNAREMHTTKDGRYGNGTCSLDFSLFEDTRPSIKTLTNDLTKIIMEAVKSDIYIYDSFFNILGAGGGSTPHDHINQLDKDIGLDLGKQKYSLVYYLRVGDQNCSEPGILKLYDPVEDILPHEGMITIIPATRKHSAVYGGNTDRVMIGVNFYSL